MPWSKRSARCLALGLNSNNGSNIQQLEIGVGGGARFVRREPRRCEPAVLSQQPSVVRSHNPGDRRRSRTTRSGATIATYRQTTRPVSSRRTPLSRLLRRGVATPDCCSHAPPAARDVYAAPLAPGHPREGEQALGRSAAADALPLKAALLHLDTDFELHRLSRPRRCRGVAPDDETSGRRPCPAAGVSRNRASAGCSSSLRCRKGGASRRL